MKELMPSEDPCVEPSRFSWSRFCFFTLIFLIFLPGGISLFFFFDKTRIGIEVASVASYTAGVILYTFSSNRGMQRYLFSCPFVRAELPRLALRHVGFLIALIALQTGAFLIQPHLSPFWLNASGAKRSLPPFVDALFVAGGVLLLAEVITNRSLLDRAHKLS